jgi:hypothetical protein
MYSSLSVVRNAPQLHLSDQAGLRGVCTSTLNHNFAEAVSCSYGTRLLCRLGFDIVRTFRTPGAFLQ